MNRTSSTDREARQLGTLPLGDIGCIVVDEIAAEDQQGLEGLRLPAGPVEIDDIGLDGASTLAGDGGMLGWESGLGGDGFDDGLPGQSESVGHLMAEKGVPAVLATSILLAVAAVTTDSMAAGAVRW